MITCNNVEFVGNINELRAGINNFFESGFFSDISEKIKIKVSGCEKGFVFECTEDEVNISYNQKSDFFRALSYLKRYIKNDDSVRLVQNPITDSCGVMLDCSRNAVRNIDSLKKQIRIMSLMGMNSLMLYTEDTYEIKGEPYFGYLRGRYTEKEILEIDDYAFSLGIELIPCIQTLGHLTSALRWSCFDDIRDTEDVLMCDEEKTYIFLEKAILQIKKLFRTNQIHIGMDEAQMMGNGQYFEKYGYVDSKTVMLRHVNRVVELCKKYGLNPMMWSDMYFRLATGTYGNPDYVIDEQTAEEMHKKIPDGLTLVYWQYEETDKELYSSLLNEHKKLTPDIMYAGGASIWGGFTPHIVRSIKSATAALNACKEKGVKKLLLTLWGDCGAECSQLTALPILQMYAEMTYTGNVPDEKELDIRLNDCTSTFLEFYKTLELPDLTTSTQSELATPSKYILYQDVPSGFFDKHIDESFPEIYEQHSEKLAELIKKTNDFDYIAEVQADLCDVLSIKSRINRHVSAAYEKRDMLALIDIKDNMIPDLLCRIVKFSDSFHKRWEIENKIFGIENFDIHIGGLISRVETLKERLEEFCSNKVLSIPELDENKLYFDERKDLSLDINTNCTQWHRIATPSIVANVI